jgi:hypothetical protein
LLANIRGVSQPTISKQIKVLRRFGYVVDLVPVGKKKPGAFQRGFRYFIPTLEGDLPPPLEVIKSDILAEVRTPPDV